jgi:hypothetical protein
VTFGVRSGWIGDCIDSLYSNTMEMEDIIGRLIAETKALMKTGRKEIMERLEVKVEATQRNKCANESQP